MKDKDGYLTSEEIDDKYNSKRTDITFWCGAVLGFGPMCISVANVIVDVLGERGIFDPLGFELDKKDLYLVPGGFVVGRAFLYLADYLYKRNERKRYKAHGIENLFNSKEVSIWKGDERRREDE